MAFGRKRGKNKNPQVDEYGIKEMPFTTNTQAMEYHGIKPIRGKSAKSNRVVRKIVAFSSIAFVVLLVLSAFSGLIAQSKLSGIAAEVDENYSPAFKSRYDSLGKSIIQSYFSHNPPPVNLLSQANWPGVSGGGEESAPVDVQGLSLVDAYQTDYSVDAIKDKDEKKAFPNPKNELLTYYGTIDGKQYEFGVYLIIPDITDTSQLPYLVSPPTIMPMTQLVDAGIEGSEPSGEDFAETDLNEGTLKNVTRWASAYAQGDSDTLKSLTGDGRVESVYPGVGGFTLVGDPEVQWAYEYAEGETERIVARVAFSMSMGVSSSGEESIAGDGSSGQFEPRQVMDILLGDYEEGQANILAWGPGGMWQTLEPRMNAIVPISPDDKDGGAINSTDTEDDETDGSDGSDGSLGDDPEETTSESDVPGAPSLSSDTSTTRASEESDDEEEETSTARKKSSSSKSSSSKKTTTSAPKKSGSKKTSTSKAKKTSSTKTP